jgi:phosphohistidine swiveling domain-containing protein
MTQRYYISDTALSEQFPIYTRANVGEVFPDPVTPLTSSTLLFISELGWREAWHRMGAFAVGEFPTDEFSQLGVVGGYCYLNASLIRLFGERAPGLTWKDMDEQFFGAQPGIPPYEEIPGDFDPEATKKIGETFGWALSVTAIDDLEELTADRVRTKQIHADRPDFIQMSNVELWEYFEELGKLHQRLFSHHIFASYLATVPVGIISAVATAVGRPDLIMPIMAGLGHVDSAEPSHAMWDLSRLASASASVSEQFDAGVDGLLGRIDALDSNESRSFLSSFADFVDEYGSRGPNEWEARSPTWETQPTLALSAIDRMRIAPAEMAPSAQHEIRSRQRADASEELLALVEDDVEAHGQLTAAIASLAVWLPGRERTKTNNIRLVHELRMPMRELGRRLVEAGAFDEIEDFGMVLRDEYPALLADPTSMLATIRERRAEYEDLLTREAQFVFVGVPDPPATWRVKGADTAQQLQVGEMLQGLPGCPGSAEGRARVILDSHDPTDLEPGDILIAPITDPSWTPLFVPSAAVVVDVGAALSHAVIVSRELGIPCVISATDATGRIPNGALIRVDGDAGEVTVLEV